MNNFRLLCMVLTGLFTSTSLLASFSFTAPQVNASAIDRTVCIGEDLFLIEDGGDAVSWSWVGPSGFTTTTQNPTIQNIQIENYGLYSVTVSDASGCTAEGSVNISQCGIQTEAYKDCDLAYSLNESEPLIFEFSDGIGSDEDVTTTSCMLLEFTSLWIKWTAQYSCDLTFVLTPQTNQDLDFVVFENQVSDNCADMEQIRCMASGGSSPMSSEDCLGPTGLVIGETDIVEEAGCNDGSNNFLAPILTKEGSTYYMCINNFSQNGEYFTLEMVGLELEDCESSSSRDFPPDDFSFSVTRDFEFLRVELEKVTNSMTVIDIRDLTGRKLQPLTKTDQRITLLPIHELSSGNYLLTVQQEGRRSTKNFVVVR